MKLCLKYSKTLFFPDTVYDYRCVMISCVVCMSVCLRMCDNLCRITLCDYYLSVYLSK